MNHAVCPLQPQEIDTVDAIIRRRLWYICSIHSEITVQKLFMCGSDATHKEPHYTFLELIIDRVKSMEDAHAISVLNLISLCFSTSEIKLVVLLLNCHFFSHNVRHKPVSKQDGNG